MENPVYSLIKTEENTWKTNRIPLTTAKDWNMHEHIERCFNVANGWFHSGQNDGNRPYKDIVTPIIDVAFRSEGFDVKDIVPYVDDVYCAYKSFLVKKYHPQWARENQLDTFIDEVVESSIIYDLVLIKDIKETRPEVVKLQEIAFCDQSDVLVGPLCLKHPMTPAELMEYEGKWDSAKIEEAIIMAEASKKVPLANDQKAKSPSKYIEVYELYGKFPEYWYKDGGSDRLVDQLHVVCFYLDQQGEKNGLTLFKGKSKSIKQKFKALKIDQVRSHGRACGRSIVERLFEPQVWANYSGIKLKKMLDASVNLLQTDDETLGNKKLSELKDMTIIKHETGKPISRVDMGIQNFQAVQSYGLDKEAEARGLGSASEAQLGKAPVSGTPFALQNLIVQQGEGIHEYRRGKISTFFADVLYPEMILPSMVKKMNDGLKFSEELSLDELEEITKTVVTNKINERIKELVLEKGVALSPEERATLTQIYTESFTKGGNRKFFEIIKGELSDVPIKVFVNVAGKQRYMAQNADKLSKLITTLLQAGVPLPQLTKQINQLLEESGMSSVNFGGVLEGREAKSIPSPISREELNSNVPIE